MNSNYYTFCFLCFREFCATIFRIKKIETEVYKTQIHAVLPRLQSSLKIVLARGLIAGHLYVHRLKAKIPRYTWTRLLFLNNIGFGYLEI